MKTKISRWIAMILVLVIQMQVVAFAEETPPEVFAETAILGDAVTGKIIYEKDSDKKMYPASMTKLVTALVTLEYLSPDALITVGTEINEIPLDSSKAGHVKGETLSVKNLIRGLMIPSGNDSANVLAVAVARKIKNDENLPFEECIQVFTDLMNEKAVALGAKNSHFANAHGYHDENHYTTAQDMFYIAQAALKNETLREIASEKGYSGDGAENSLESNTTLKTKNYNWVNHNLLLTDNEHQYEYATGLKTGFTDEAGACLTAAAEKDGKQLIAVVFNSEDPNRWIDTKNLFEYGFNNFEQVDLQKAGDVIDTVALAGHNRLLGDTLDVIVKEDVEDFMKKEDVGKLEKTVEYNSDFLAEKKGSSNTTTALQAPIAKDTEVGKISYKVGTEILKEVPVYAATEVEKSTLITTVQYFFKNLTSNLFSIKGVLVLGGIVLCIAVVLLIIKSILAHRRRRRSKYIFKSKRSRRRRRRF